MNVTILLINGDPEIHATGCRDIARKARHCSHGGTWTEEHDSITSLAESFACDFIAEGSMSADEALGWVSQGVMPCVKLPVE
jgi:deoxycytidylate deaminase